MFTQNSTQLEEFALWRRKIIDINFRACILLLIPCCHLFLFLHFLRVSQFSPRNISHRNTEQIIVFNISSLKENEQKVAVSRPSKKAHHAIKSKKAGMSILMRAENNSTDVSERLIEMGDELVTKDIRVSGIQKLDIEKLRNDFIKNEKAQGAFVEAKGEKKLDKQITLESRLAEATKRAQRSDCRKAYSSTGLLAIPQLARDLIADKGCKW